MVGTKKVHFDKIAALVPDLIIANKEENERSQIDQLCQHFPVWISNISTFEEAMKMIYTIGNIVDKGLKANQIITQSKDILQQLNPKNINKAAYLIWQKPYMTIGKDTYIHDMLKHSGFENVYGDQTRYPTFYFNRIKRPPTRYYIIVFRTLSF